MVKAMDALDKLFGNQYRAKLLRLFIANPDLVFDPKLASKRLGMGLAPTRREFTVLKGIDFIQPKTVILSVPPSPAQIKKQLKTKNGKKSKSKTYVTASDLELKEVRQKMSGWQINKSFPFISQLKVMLSTQFDTKRADLLKRFRGTGRIKFLAISGVLIDDTDSRVDVVIVGDGLKRLPIERSIRQIEAEVGKELRYAIFDTADFTYRFNASDKFIRDLLDYPHERIINKLTI